jgi:hypothetical protein
VRTGANSDVGAQTGSGGAGLASTHSARDGRTTLYAGTGLSHSGQRPCCRHMRFFGLARGSDQAHELVLASSSWRSTQKASVSSLRATRTRAMPVPRRRLVAAKSERWGSERIAT